MRTPDTMAQAPAFNKPKVSSGSGFWLWVRRVVWGRRSPGLGVRSARGLGDPAGALPLDLGPGSPLGCLGGDREA